MIKSGCYVKCVDEFIGDGEPNIGGILLVAATKSHKKRNWRGRSKGGKKAVRLKGWIGWWEADAFKLLPILDMLEYRAKHGV